MMEQHQGYDPDGLMTMEIELPEKKYAEPSRRAQFYADLLAAIRRLPGVVAADASSGLPSLGGGSRAFEVEGQPVAREAERPVAAFRVISTGFFETMRIPLLRGRTFSDADDKETLPVAVISDKMARQFWPEDDPLGRRFRVSGEENAPWVTVVGVVGDVVQDWFLGAPQPTFTDCWLSSLVPECAWWSGRATSPPASPARCGPSSSSWIRTSPYSMPGV
jgi:putative ABC transport system permease protein